MLVLGWHGNPRLDESQDDTSGMSYHDSAAVLLNDGVIVAAIEEERLNRIKHSTFFPARAIRFCLAEAGASLRDLDAIVTDSAEDFWDFVVSREATINPREPFQTGRALLGQAFEREFGVAVADKIRFCRHHTAHLYGAWYPSGFPEALTVCLDGYGDGASGLVAHCRNDEPTILRHLPESASLGNFYSQQLYFLGYQRFDEFKVMGLAPYGDPEVFISLFEEMYELQPEGKFTLLSPTDRLLLMTEVGVLPEARRKGQPFTQTHKDYAAALQLTLERIVDHVVNHFQQVTGSRRLCLSGGVAHNCTMNGKLARSGRFSEVYVQPAAHDAGNALGAALAVVHEAGKPLPRNVLPRLFLGTNLGEREAIGSQLSRWRNLVDSELLDDAPQTAARLLADGAVIGWAQGRSEFGPRALGNRSILADPRPAENKRIINAMVKKREDYRPFAPAVAEESLRDYFDVPPEMQRVPFMIIVLPVLPHARAQLGAVTHVDGSARVQSVSPSDNPRFHAVITAFGRLTGVPIVLNTSFNNHAEPIVDSVDDCITTFLTTGIHSLIVGDWLVKKREGGPADEALLDLIPSLPVGRGLVRRTSADGSPWLGVEPKVNPYIASQPTRLSKELFHLLLEDDGSSLRARCARLGYDDSGLLKQLGIEVLALWSERVIQLRPATSPGEQTNRTTPCRPDR